MSFNHDHAARLEKLPCTDTKHISRHLDLKSNSDISEIITKWKYQNEGINNNYYLYNYQELLLTVQYLNYRNWSNRNVKISMNVKTQITCIWVFFITIYNVIHFPMKSCYEYVHQKSTLSLFFHNSYGRDDKVHSPYKIKCHALSFCNGFEAIVWYGTLGIVSHWLYGQLMRYL